MIQEDDQPQPLHDNRFLTVDPRRIDLNDNVEMAYWTKYLDISEGALRAAVGAVGNNAGDVKNYLALLDGDAPHKPG